MSVGTLLKMSGACLRWAEACRKQGDRKFALTFLKNHIRRREQARALAKQAKAAER